MVSLVGIRFGQVGMEIVMEVGDPGGGAFVRSLCHCGYFPVDLNWVDKLSTKSEVPANGVVYIRAGVQPVCFRGPLP